MSVDVVIIVESNLFFFYIYFCVYIMQHHLMVDLQCTYVCIVCVSLSSKIILEKYLFVCKC